MTLTQEPASGETRAQKPPKRRWPWYVAGGVTLAALAVAAWWFAESTVPATDYDDVEAQLRTTQDALSDAEARLAMLTGEIESLDSSVEALTAANDELDQHLADEQGRLQMLDDENEGLVAAIVAAREVAQALAYMEVDWSPENLADVEKAGADLTMADEILEALGESATMTDWAGLTASLERTRAIRAIDDDVLQESFMAWMASDSNTNEEWVAYVEMHWRLPKLLLMALTEL